MDIYETLMKERSTFSHTDEISNSFDDYLACNDRVKMASIDDFFGFTRVSTTTLIHKAKKDLWKVAENEEGEVFIERLFDPATHAPLRV